MLRKAVYPKVEARLNEIAKSLNEKGFTPNQLTLSGLGFVFLTGWIYAAGHFFIAGWMLLLSSMTDLLDGPLARVSGKASSFGAFLDSTVDRYADFFIFGGLALYYARTGQAGWLILTLGIIMGSYVTSYTKARAENFIKSCSVGVFERAERVILFALGSILTPLLPLAIWILFIGTNATAIQRILFTKKTLTENKFD